MATTVVACSLLVVAVTTTVAVKETTAVATAVTNFGRKKAVGVFPQRLFPFYYSALETSTFGESSGMSSLTR